MLLRILAKPFDIKLGITEGTVVSALSTLINYVAPFRAGAGFRAYYLNQRHSLSVKHFAAIFGGHYILQFFCNSLIALVVLSWFAFTSCLPNPLLIVFFSTLVIVLFYLVFFAPSISEPKSLFWGKIARIINSWDNIRKNRRIVCIFSVTSVSQVLVTGLALKLAFSASNIDITYSKALLLCIIGSFGLLVSITPGGIGIVEGLFLASSLLIGVGSEEMLVAALIRRGAGILTLFLMVPFALIWLKVKGFRLLE